MTDKDVPLDAAKQAVRIAEIEGVLQLQAQSLKTAVDNMSNTLASVQAEVRGVNTSLHELTVQQARGDLDRQAIIRLEQSLNELHERVEGWIGKAATLASNERVDEINNKVIHSRGFVLGAGALVTLLLSGFLWTLNERFAASAAALNKTAEDTRYNRQLIDQARERQHAMELHLARTTNYNAGEQKP